MSGNGSISLNGVNASTGLPSQMSDEWVKKVIEKMRKSDNQDIVNLANKLNIALKENKIQKLVTAVDKSTGEIVVTSLGKFSSP